MSRHHHSFFHFHLSGRIGIWFAQFLFLHCARSIRRFYFGCKAWERIKLERRGGDSLSLSCSARTRLQKNTKAGVAFYANARINVYKIDKKIISAKIHLSRLPPSYKKTSISRQTPFGACREFSNLVTRT